MSNVGNIGSVDCQHSGHQLTNGVSGRNRGLVTCRFRRQPSGGFTVIGMSASPRTRVNNRTDTLLTYIMIQQQASGHRYSMQSLLYLQVYLIAWSDTRVLLTLRIIDTNKSALSYLANPMRTGK